MANENSQIGDFEANRIIFDLAPCPMWIYDRETFKFLLVNQEAIRHYGYSHEEFLKMTIKEIRPPEALPELEKALAKIHLRTGIFKENLFKHKKKDGSIIHVQIKSNLIDYQRKKCAIVTAIDLTEKYNQAKHIEKQSQYLEKIGIIQEILLKVAPWPKALEECFKILGKFLDVNGILFFQTISIGQGESQRLAWHANSKTTPDDNLFHCKLFLDHPPFLETLKNGIPLEIAVCELPNSNTKALLEEQEIKSLLELPIIFNQEFSGVFILYDCTTRRKWTENEFQLLKSLTSTFAHIIHNDLIRTQLVNNEARFRSLVQNGNDLIAIIDPNANYKYVAPTSLKVLGIPAEEFIGKNAFEYIHKEDVPRVLKDLEQLKTGGRITIKPYRFKDAQGNWRWIETDLTNHLSNPAIEGIVANTKDVSIAEEKRMGEQLLTAIIRELSQPGSLSGSLAKALSLITKLSEIKVSEVWLINEDKSRLDLIAKSCESKKQEVFHEHSRAFHTVEKELGLPGQIWQLEQFIIFEHLQNNPQFIRSTSANLAGLTKAFGIPIIYNKEFLGCIVCLSNSGKKDLFTQIKLLKEVGRNLGPLLKHKMTEELYRSFFNISPDPHGILSFDGYLKKVNMAFVDILGYDQDEISRHPITYFLHEDDKAKANNRLEALVGGAHPESLEVRFITKDSSIIWLVINSYVIPASKIFILAAKDITAQKESSIELLEAYQRLETAQKIAKIGYWSRDLSSDIAEWSEETYRIYGYSASNFIPSLENVEKTYPPEDRHLIKDEITKLLSPEKTQSFEHRIITASKQVKWVRQEIRLQNNTHQKPFKIEGTIQDITERKEYEIQLALSNERFKLATEASNEMIWETDHKQQVTTRSKVYEKTISYQALEPFMIGNSWYSKIPEPELQEVWLSLQRAFEDKKTTYWTNEYKLISDKGDLMYFVDRCFIIRDSLGTPLRSIGSVLDITSSRKQMDIILQQNKNLREIAWFQSHVVRAPLSRIMSLIYLAKEFDGGDKSIEEIFDLIAASAKELDEVIHNVIRRTEAIKKDDRSNPAD